MGWFIHHVNVQAFDVQESAKFYRDIIGLKEGVRTYPETVGAMSSGPDRIAAFGRDNRGIHVVKANPSFPIQNKLFHNPTIGGHFAITVTNLEIVKARLEEAGHIVSDAGVYAMAGMRQIYVFDPCQRVMEINQAIDDSAGRSPRQGEAHDLEMQEGGWTLHHVNLPAHSVPATVAYLRDLIGLEESQWIPAESSSISEFIVDPEMLAVFGDDNRGIHVVKPTAEFAAKNGFKHNPTIGGHFAVTVPDLEAVKSRLSASDIQFTDAGSYAMAGMAQVYAYDPSMNLVEINQVM
ncbi:MAG: VOC family protein [Rhodospirillales bacterium]|jgi:catechol 2,3-dioxygenase-like lactoylglutathione lyase family enzyme